jgi:hypothetical protein
VFITIVYCVWASWCYKNETLLLLHTFILFLYYCFILALYFEVFAVPYSTSFFKCLPSFFCTISCGSSSSVLGPFQLMRLWWQSHGRLIITLIMTLLEKYKPGQFEVHSSGDMIILRLGVWLNFINLFQIKTLSKMRSRQSTRDSWPSGQILPR